MNNEQYREPYTEFIVADVRHGKLNKERLESMRSDFANQQIDPEYLASLEEAIKLLYGPEELVRRMCNREQPGSEV